MNFYAIKLNNDEFLVNIETLESDSELDFALEVNQTQKSKVIDKLASLGVIDFEFIQVN